MRQRILGSHTPPCHRRMVITTQFNVLPCCNAAQTSSVPLRAGLGGEGGQALHTVVRGCTEIVGHLLQAGAGVNHATPDLGPQLVPYVNFYTVFYTDILTDQHTHTHIDMYADTHSYADAHLDAHCLADFDVYTHTHGLIQNDMHINGNTHGLTYADSFLDTNSHSNSHTSMNSLSNSHTITHILGRGMDGWMDGWMDGVRIRGATT